MTGTTDLMTDLGEARQERDEARAEAKALRAAIQEWADADREWDEADEGHWGEVMTVTPAEYRHALERYEAAGAALHRIAKGEQDD